MTTIALIDDHLIVRSGFAQLLGLEADFQVAAEFGSGREALARLPGRGVQVCICDILMPDILGFLELSSANERDGDRHAVGTSSSPGAGGEQTPGARFSLQALQPG